MPLTVITDDSYARLIMKRYAFAASAALFCMPVHALEAGDTVVTQKLEEIVVKARLEHVSPEVATFIPTRRQKNAALTGTDLLAHMALPQLGAVTENTVTTSAGQSVDMFIDYVPASDHDLEGMRMSDVRKVEYYDHPLDPRFQGKAHVINFVMRKYEYGGYFKTYASGQFVANSGQLGLFARIRHGRMTYDVAAGGWYSANDHLCQSMSETYRLPKDGNAMVFERVSRPSQTVIREHSIWPTVKVMYNTDRITMVNTLGGNFFYSPRKFTTGTVSFTPPAFSAADYADNRDSRINSITYSGYWTFVMPHGNTISFNPYYSWSHTRQHSVYSEASGTWIENGAADDTRRATAALRFSHDFGKWGNITAIGNIYYLGAHTRYSGTAEVQDRLTTVRIGPGLFYNYRNDRFNGLLGSGFNYDRSGFDGKPRHSAQPWIDASVQYSFSDKNSVSVDFHHATWTLPSAFRSTAVIMANPLLSYTGNPGLRPYKNYDFGMRYVWMPENRYNIAIFANGWIVDDRYAYVYQPSAAGILRTITQNAGVYSQWLYGVTATVRMFDNRLVVNGQLSHRIVRNGAPYDWVRQRVLWYIQGLYYFGAWNIGVRYQSPQEYCEDHMTGVWMKEKNVSEVSAGWGGSFWNIQARILNPFRWNWRAATSEMSTPDYKISKTYYNTSHHCYVVVSATYTFGFGAKIQHGNEASQQTGTSSSILK